MDILPPPQLAPSRLAQKTDRPINVHTRYFVINNKAEGSFQKVSPFILHKSIQSAIGAVESVKRLKSGDILIKVSSAAQANKISSCSTIGSFSVQISPHASLNSSKGVISESDLLYSSEEEILENLNDQGVVAVRRITIRRDGKIINTKHIILTFNSPKLPSHITAAYLRCPVRPYIPNPLRCFQCQRFGHSKFSCRGSVTCARCAEVGHDAEKCSKTPLCVNCKQAHPSYSRSCPSWKIEKEIQIIKQQNNVSYPEARKIITSRTPKPGLSFSAAVTAKPMISIGTQTELSQFNIINRLATQKPKSTNPKPVTMKTKNNEDKPKETNTANRTKHQKKDAKQKLAVKPFKQKKSFTFNPPKNLTFKDFLKNRPISPSAVSGETDDQVKFYVSPEEDMCTDWSDKSDAEAVNTAPR
jgi:hypothetical protein